MARKQITPVQAAKEAGEIHASMNIFAAVQALVHASGLVPYQTTNAAERITKICQDEQRRLLRDYDRAIAVVAATTPQTDRSEA